MAAPVLLCDYRMKKAKVSAPPKESAILVDMKMMRAFHAEVMSRFSSTDAKIDGIESRIDSLESRIDSLESRIDSLEAKIESLEAKIESLEAKIDAGVAQMNASFHKALLLFEEQNLRNKQAYDAAAVSYEAIQELKHSIRPECLKG